MVADPDCRLITLLGPGGSGKSRLAIEFAGNAYNTFADGAVFVALAPLSNASLIVPTVAAALEFSLDSHATPKSQLLHYLRGQALLLVLDNFEHLLPSLSQPQVGADGNPSALPTHRHSGAGTQDTLLVTSRERLNLQGEWVYDVGGLDVPTGDEAMAEELRQPSESVSWEQNFTDSLLSKFSASTLFVRTAQRMQSGFVPSPADQDAILRICRLAKGMPLAIELAAAWTRLLSCAELAAELAESIDILTAMQRDLPAHHRSMRAVFDHSWRLLSTGEQQVFARCSVFRGGFTREAAAEVAEATLPLLAALVDKSLLHRNRAGRYTVHELARQFAADRLVEMEEDERTRSRHLTFFMALSEDAEPKLRSGPQVVQWHDRIELEHDNIRTALDWALTSGEFEPGFRMVGALWEFWMNRGHAAEGQAQAERFLARAEASAPTGKRVKALHTAGVLAFYQGHHQAANAWAVEGVVICRELGPDGRSLLAMLLQTQGYISRGLNDFETMKSSVRKALRLGQELQDEWFQGPCVVATWVCRPCVR